MRYLSLLRCEKIGADLKLSVHRAASWRESGSEFHSIGPATEKARRPNVLRRFRVIIIWWRLADLRRWRLEMMTVLMANFVSGRRRRFKSRKSGRRDAATRTASKRSGNSGTCARRRDHAASRWAGLTGLRENSADANCCRYQSSYCCKGCRVSWCAEQHRVSICKVFVYLFTSFKLKTQKTRFLFRSFAVWIMDNHLRSS